MTLEQLGSLGEFLGALAVLASLIYVAREIRENSRSTRLAAMQSTMLAAQNVMALPAENLGLARVVRLGLTDPGQLDDDEFQQLRYWLFSLLRAHEDLFVQHKAGVIDNETWLARSSSVRSILSTPGGRKVWSLAGAYRADFKAWVDSSLSGDRPPAA